MGWTYQHRDKGMSNDEFMLTDVIGANSTILASTTIDKVYYAAVKNPDGEVWMFVCMINWVPRDYYNFGYKGLEERMGPNDAKCPDKILDLLPPIPECSHDEQVCKFCTATIVDHGGIWIQEPRESWSVEVAGPCCYSGWRGDAPTPGEGRRPYHQPGGTSSCGNCWAREWRAACRKYNAKPKPKKGDRVKFTQPIEFTNGASLAEFVFDGRNSFTNANGYGRYNIRGWKDRQYEVVS